MSRLDCGAVAIALLAMGQACATDMGMGSPPLILSFSADRAEARLRDGDDAFVWDAEGWIGGDLNKVGFRTRGETDDNGSAEEAELQLLFSRAILPFWDLHAGLRHDLRPNPSKTYAVLSVEGTAPYRVEVEASAFVSEDGDASAELELEYDLRLTQQWILQPRVDFDFAFSQVSELDVGKGPSELETGLRLRYEFTKQFAPYLGVVYETALGDTRDLRKDAGEDRSSWSLGLGLKAWF